MKYFKHQRLYLELLVDIIKEHCRAFFKCSVNAPECGIRRSNGIQGLYVAMPISPKIFVPKLDQKEKEFITLRVKTILANLSRQDFISHIDALMERKLASPRSPAHQNDKYCEEILADKNKFGRDPNAFEYLDAIEFGKREAREAQFLKDIKDSNDLDTFYQDVLGFYSAYLANAEKAVSTFVGRDYDPPPGYIEGDKDKEEINVKE